MGQIVVQGTVLGGPTTIGAGFPQALFTTILATNPTPKPFSLASGVISRRLAVASPAFAPLQGVGPTDTVQRGDFLYFRSDSQVLLRLSQTDPLNPLNPPLQRELYVNGLVIIEFPQSSPLVLLEGQGSATLEYLITGQLLSIIDTKHLFLRRIVMSETKKDSFNRADLNVLADMFRAFKLGDMIRALPTYLRKATTALSSSVVATARVVSSQSQEAPAAQILSAYARAGAGAPGALAIVATVPPAAGQVSIAPNGSLLTATADAWTDLDIAYTPEKGEVLSFSLPVVANTLTLPSSVTDRGAVLLLSANATAGTVTGQKIIVAPGTAPAATQSALNAAKTTVAFNAADAVTQATVTLLVASAADVSALLSQDSTFV